MATLLSLSTRAVIGNPVNWLKLQEIYYGDRSMEDLIIEDILPQIGYDHDLLEYNWSKALDHCISSNHPRNLDYVADNKILIFNWCLSLKRIPTYGKRRYRTINENSEKRRKLQ